MRSAVVALLVVVLVRSAMAQPAGGKQAEAEKRFQSAEALYKSGDYLRAAAEYQAAYDLSGLPGLLYNVAQSYRLGGDKAKAVATYRQFLERAPQHQLAAVARGHLEALERELAAASQPEQSPAVVPEDPASDVGVVAAAPPGSPPKGRGLRIAGMVTAGVGLVALGGALHYGIEARKASNAISDNDETWTEGLLDRYDEGERAETRMFILSGVGAAALVGGGVLYYLGWRAGRAETISVTPAAGGAAVSFGGSF